MLKKKYEIFIPKSFSINYEDGEWFWSTIEILPKINKRTIDRIEISSSAAEVILDMINANDTLLPVICNTTEFDIVAGKFAQLSSVSNRNGESNAHNIMTLIEEANIASFKDHEVRSALTSIYNIAEIACENNLPIIVQIYEKEDSDPYEY